MHDTGFLMQKRTECRASIICHVPEKGMEVMKPFVASSADRHAIDAICLSGQRSNINFLGVNGFRMPTRSVFPHRGQTIEIHTAFWAWDPGRWMNALKPATTRNSVHNLAVGPLGLFSYLPALHDKIWCPDGKGQAFLKIPTDLNKKLSRVRQTKHGIDLFISGLGDMSR